MAVEWENRFDGGTKVRDEAEGQLYGVFTLIQPKAAVFSGGERKRVIKDLKKSLERSV